MTELVVPLEDWPDQPLVTKEQVEKWIPRMVPSVEIVHVSDSPSRPGEALCVIYGSDVGPSTAAAVEWVLAEYGAMMIQWTAVAIPVPKPKTQAVIQEWSRASLLVGFVLGAVVASLIWLWVLL